MQFTLFVGTDHALAQYEVEAQIKDSVQIDPGIYQFSSASIETAINQVSKLGCAIKLLSEISIWEDDPKILEPLITTPNYSITQIPLNSTQNAVLNNTVKEILGNKFRYLLAKDNMGLSPIVLNKQHVTEFLIYKNNLLKTIWVHDVTHWINKDRNLPRVNSRAGMLPPKVARMLINMAGIASNPDKKLLDPFCGSGHVVIEGVELGFFTIGSDLSANQIEDTKANLDSLGIGSQNYQLVLSDASKLSQHLNPSSIDLIVTEPFMGRPDTRSDRIPDMVKGLKKMYLGALKSWLSLLKPAGVVVMVFPRVTDGKRSFVTSSIIDDPHLLGYNVKTRDILYSREGAKLQREIVILQKF